MSGASMIEDIGVHVRVVRTAIEQVPVLERIVERVLASFSAGGRLYILDNGGGAADVIVGSGGTDR